jgi:hypothetical protein
MTTTTTAAAATACCLRRYVISAVSSRWLKQNKTPYISRGCARPKFAANKNRGGFDKLCTRDLIYICEYRRPDGRKCMRAASVMRVVGIIYLYILLYNCSRLV